LAKREKPRGYSARAAREHPGVTISEETRQGEKRFLLRWREVLPGGRRGKRKACYAVDAKGALATSRSKAHAHAVTKSAELKAELKSLENLAPSAEFKPDATWSELVAAHAKYLERKGRGRKTITSYGQVDAFLNSWRSRPALPKQLQLADLEAFGQHVAAHKKQRGESGNGQNAHDDKLSPHSVRTILVHLKGILNFGRKRMKCVRLDGETIAEGLQPPVKAFVRPVALPSSKLRQILDAAKKHNDGTMFPLLTFLMLTGCRLGEAETVRWTPSKPGAAESWIDFDGGRVVIYARKTSRQRVIPFEKRPALRTLLECLRDFSDTERLPFVFGGKLPLALRDKREVEMMADDGAKVVGKSGKAALYAVRAQSGADWKPKDFRSTLATFLCNSNLGMNVYAVAGELGHDYAVLTKHYSGQYQLPPKLRDAGTVEAVLGIADLLQEWSKLQGLRDQAPKRRLA
jgi:integrase